MRAGGEPRRRSALDAGIGGVYRVLAEMAGQPVGAGGGAERALERFAVWFGRFAGDAALFFGARGGVYIGGGIAPTMVDAS